MNPKQEAALKEYLQEAIIPLIEQVLVKKLGQSMSFAAQELMQPKRSWQGLTHEEVWDMEAYKMALTDQETQWLYRFARAIEAKLKEKNEIC